MKTMTLSAILIVVATLTMSFIIDGWDVPEAEAAKENPVKSDEASIAAGQALYVKYCKMCHAADGSGGKMAGESDLTSEAFQAQTDGAIYYKTDVGYGKMPAYKTKIADETDKWHLVNYMRTLKK